MVVQMINVGETTGALDTMLSKIADFYEEEVDTAVAGLLTLLEPVMIAFLGVVVGGIVIAMYLPIFDLIQQADRADEVQGSNDAFSVRRRLLWLIGGRAAVVTLLLGSAILIRSTRPGRCRSIRSSSLIGLTYALTVVYVLLLRQAEQHRWLVDVQLACDAVIVSALVHMTGGIIELLLVALHAADHRREHDRSRGAAG